MAPFHHVPIFYVPTPKIKESADSVKWASQEGPGEKKACENEDQT